MAGGPLDEPVPVSDLVIFDPADTHAVSSGSIVLAVGHSAEGAEATKLLEYAGERGAAAVVFRSDRPRLPIARLATSVGVHVLTVPLDVRWSHVYTLLRTAMANFAHFPVAGEARVAVGDLFAFADAIAGAVGGPVTIEDPHWQVLAYSNLDYEIDQPRRDTILGRTPPSTWQRRIEETGVGSALRSGTAVVQFEGRPGEGLVPRLVAPVRAGDEFLGSIWVAEAEIPLEAAAESELARAAELAAVHLLSHRASEHIKRRTRGAFVREVLEGSAASRPTFAMPGSSGPFTVLVFTVGRDAAPQSYNPERVLSIVSLYCESRHPDAMCALIDDAIWSVVPALARDERQAMIQMATRIVERVDASLGIGLYGAIGTTAGTIADVPRSRRAAEHALAVVQRRQGPNRVVHIEDVQAQAVLLRILDWASEDEELMRGKLKNLLEHDRKRGTMFRDTLRAYLDASGDIRKAAAQLSVHPNTLRYRLKRIAALSGLDLNDPEERIVTELQLRMG